MKEITLISYKYRSKDGTCKYLLFKSKEDCIELGISKSDIEESSEYDFSESKRKIRDAMSKYQKEYPFIVTTEDNIQIISKLNSLTDISKSETICVSHTKIESEYIDKIVVYV